jgi:CBS domain-containing protein
MKGTQTDAATSRLAQAKHAIPQTVAELARPHSVHVDPGFPILKTLELMNQTGIRRLPVVVDGRAIGVVAARDILRHVPAPSQDGLDSNAVAEFKALTAVEVMSAPVLSVREDEPLQRAIQQMLDHNVCSILVSSPQGEFTGTLTLSDVSRAFLVLVRMLG